MEADRLPVAVGVPGPDRVCLGLVVIVVVADAVREGGADRDRDEEAVADLERVADLEGDGLADVVRLVDVDAVVVFVAARVGDRGAELVGVFETVELVVAGDADAVLDPVTDFVDVVDLSAEPVFAAVGVIGFVGLAVGVARVDRVLVLECVDDMVGAMPSRALAPTSSSAICCDCATETNSINSVSSRILLLCVERNSEVSCFGRLELIPPVDYGADQANKIRERCL